MQDNEEDLIFNQSDSFVQFLKEHPLVSINALETEAKTGGNAIAQAMSGNRNIPKHNWYAINNILANYGYDIDSSVNNKEE